MQEPINLKYNSCVLKTTNVLKYIHVYDYVFITYMYTLYIYMFKQT